MRDTIRVANHLTATTHSRTSFVQLETNETVASEAPCWPVPARMPAFRNLSVTSTNSKMWFSNMTSRLHSSANVPLNSSQFFNEAPESNSRGVVSAVHGRCRVSCIDGWSQQHKCIKSVRIPKTLVESHRLDPRCSRPCRIRLLLDPSLRERVLGRSLRLASGKNLDELNSPGKVWRDATAMQILKSSAS